MAKFVVQNSGQLYWELMSDNVHNNWLRFDFFDHFQGLWGAIWERNLVIVV